MRNSLTNTYRFAFVARCPNDGQRIKYVCEIKTTEMILVENIRASFPVEGYHEDIADKMHAAFGGEQTIRAFHQNIEIETVRR
jgi:hypothetical protein